MNDLYGNKNMDEDLKAISKVLKEQYGDISLPESLSSENLLKLLPEEKKKNTISLTGLLKSKRFIPILSTAAAAVMLITVFSRISLDRDFAKSATPAESPAMAAEVVQESAMAVEVSGSTQLMADDAKSNMQMDGGISSDSITAETPSASDSGEDLSMYYKTETESETETPPLDSPSIEAAGGQASRMGGASLGGSSEAHLMKETDKYSFYWRSVNGDDPDFKDFNAVLEIVDKQSAELHLIEGLPGIHAVFNVVVGSGGQLFVVGTSDSGVSVLKYSSYLIKPLNLVSSAAVTGEVKNRYDKDNFLYIASTTNKDKIALPANAREIKGSENSGVGIITVIDGNTGMVWEEYIFGIDEETVQRSGTKFIFEYTKEKTLNEIVATLNNGIVQFE